MDRLLAGQSLTTDQELISNNGWFAVRLFSSGKLGIYRTQTRHTMWVSPGLSQPGGRAEMQGDGNFVLYNTLGQPYFDTGSWGHPGCFIVMQDDGNLVVYDPANNPLWASNTTPDLLSPTIRYTEAPGYAFNETSESWKQMCASLPCFLALQWPGYASGIVEDNINGQDVVIQWWKGWCPKFLGFLGVNQFPGGVGAEVGVYRRIPGKLRPTALPFLPKPIELMVLNALGNLADNELWWPAPELNAEIEFSLTNPVNGAKFFSAGPEKSYWLAKWMDDGSYAQYQRDQGPLRWPWLPPGTPGNSNTPINWEEYVLEYTVNGKRYDSVPAGRTAPRAAPQGEIAAVTRSREKLDIFVTDQNGGVQSAAWEPGFVDGWHGFWSIGNARLPHGAPINAVSRSADKLDVFATDSAGVIRTAAWQPAFTDGWHGWFEIAGGRATPGATVTAVSRSPDKLDAFVVGTDQQVYTAAWDPAASPDWRGWWGVGKVTMPNGAPVNVVSRSRDKLDVFVTDVAGVIRTAAWEPGFTDGWHGWWEILGGRAAPGASVTAVSRSADKLDIFVVGTDGRVYTAAWDPRVSQKWRGWWAIGNLRFPAGAPIHAISRSPDKIDIFGTDIGGVIRTAAWEPGFTDGWHGWWELAGGRATPGAAISTVSRSPDNLDVFVVGTDRRVWTAAWQPGFTGGWHGWWPVR